LIIVLLGDAKWCYIKSQSNSCWY